MEKPWHSLSSEQAAQTLDSPEQGLTKERAAQRLSEGPNELVHKKGKTTLQPVSYTHLPIGVAMTKVRPMSINVETIMLWMPYCLRPGL